MNNHLFSLISRAATCHWTRTLSGFTVVVVSSTMIYSFNGDHAGMTHAYLHWSKVDHAKISINGVRAERASDLLCLLISRAATCHWTRTLAGFTVVVVFSTMIYSFDGDPPGMTHIHLHWSMVDHTKIYMPGSIHSFNAILVLSGISSHFYIETTECWWKVWCMNSGGEQEAGGLQRLARVTNSNSKGHTAVQSKPCLILT